MPFERLNRSHIRDVADGHAAAGDLAVAPAVYDRVRPSVELGYTPDDMQAGMKLRADVPLAAPWPTSPPPGVRRGRQGRAARMALSRTLRFFFENLG